MTEKRARSRPLKSFNTPMDVSRWFISLGAFVPYDKIKRIWDSQARGEATFTARVTGQGNRLRGRFRKH